MPTDQGLGATNNFLKNFVRNFLLSWVTIMFTHIIFSSTFLYLLILCSNSSTFHAYKTMDLAQEHPKFFSQKYYEDFVLNWGAITYTRTNYFTPICEFISPFQKSQIFLNFPMYKSIDQAPKSPKLSFSKKNYEDLCIELGNYNLYSHHFFTSISSSTGPFLESHKLLNFRVYSPVCVWSLKHPNSFYQKHYEELSIESGNHHVYSHYFLTSITTFTCPF